MKKQETKIERLRKRASFEKELRKKTKAELYKLAKSLYNVNSITKKTPKYDLIFFILDYYYGSQEVNI